MPSEDMRSIMLASAERQRDISFEERLAQRRRERDMERRETGGEGGEVTGADIGLPTTAGTPARIDGAPAPEDEGGFLSTAGAVAGDVSIGLTREMPFAVANGVIRAINETGDLIDSASAAARSVGIPDPRITYINPETRQFELGITMDPEGFRERLREGGAPNADNAGNIPDIPEFDQPDTVTGSLVQGVSQFLAGFIGAGKITKSAGILQGGGRLLGGARAYLNGAIADLAVFDGHEERLANLIQEVPELDNPVTEFLAADEEDTEIEGRLKNVLEGGALGLVADGLIQGIRAVRSARNARRQVEDTLGFLDRADEGAAEDIQRDVMRAGSPEGPAVTIDTPARRMSDQIAEQLRSDLAEGRRGLDPQESEHLLGAAQRWRDAVARLNPGQAPELDDLLTETRQRIDQGDVSAIMDMMDQARRAAPHEPQSLFTFLRREFGGIQDESGELRNLELGRANLLNNRSGAPMDRAREAAAEAGYLSPDSDLNDFLGLIREEAMGNRVYSANDLADVEALAARADLETELENLALDPTRPRPERRSQAERIAQLQEGEPITIEDVRRIEDDMAAAGLRGVRAPVRELLGGREIRINFNALNTDDDIQSVIGQMADAFSDEIKQARGARRTDRAVIRDSRTQSAWDALNARRQGAPLSDTEVMAAQSLYITSAENVRDAIAHAIAHPDSSTAQFAAKRAVSVHRAIQAQIAGAKADAGRALRAWNISARANAEARREMENVLNLHGGKFSPKDLERLRDITGDPQRLDAVTRRGFHPMTEVMSEWIRFAFLGNPLTQAANLAGNSFAIVYDTLPRLGAGLQGMILDDPALTRELRSVLDEYAGLAAGARAQFAAFAKRADYGRMSRSLAEAMSQPTLRGRLMGTAASVAKDNPLSATFRGRFDDYGSGGRKFQDTANSSRAVSSERFNAKAGSAWGNFLNASGAVLAAPQEFLGFADDFFKGVNHYATRYRLAARQTREELGEGASKEEYVSRMRQLVEEPSDEALEEAVHMARRRTFTEPIGGATERLLALRNFANQFAFGFPLGSLLMPFVVTPSNILKFAFMNSPAGFLFREIQEDLAAGGTRAAIARSRVASGTILSFIGMDMVANGELTGRAPNDPGERERWERLGIQEYSIKTPWGWMSYRRMEPVSTMLAIGADVQMVLQNGFENTEEPLDAMDLFGPLLGAGIQVVSSKTYLTGVAEFIQFAQDPERYGPTYARNLTSSVLVPSAVFQAERVNDPVIRDSSNMMNRIMGSVPGFSDRVPPRRDLWGRVRHTESRLGELYDALSPWAIRANDPEPIDQELSRLGDAPRMPGWTISVRGSTGVSAPVNLRHRPDIYWRYVELAGNEAPSMPGRMGLRDYLNAVISGEHPHSVFYQQLPDDPSAPRSKATFIRDRIQDAREMARSLISREYQAELRAMADASLVRQTEAQARREEVFEETGR